MPQAVIESLDYEAQGVAHVEGKTIFIEGALPGEEVEYASYRRKPTFERAVATQINKVSGQRVEPRCPHFGMCGGCSMQHMDFESQVAAKQRVLESSLWHLAKLRPEQLYAPIYGQPWGYRHRARLSVRLVPKKGGVLVGFHERRSSFICDMQTCQVLPPRVSNLLVPLRGLVESLSIVDRIPQIEVSLGDSHLVLVVRVLETPSEADREKLSAFAQSNDLAFYLQSKGPDTVEPLWPAEGVQLSYALPEFGVSLAFTPTDFTQVNHGINQVLVRRAMKLLAPAAGERIADMFCGLGNFTLPIARSGAQVFGVEGSAGLVARGKSNAERNGLAGQVGFAVANLFTATQEMLDGWGPFDKMLIDPPREGALDVVKSLAELGAPSRIVYVSCNPATLARDAGILVNEKQYRLRGAGVVNMFPHTSHVESIALFERAL